MAMTSSMMLKKPLICSQARLQTSIRLPNACIAPRARLSSTSWLAKQHAERVRPVVMRSEPESAPESEPESEPEIAPEPPSEPVAAKQPESGATGGGAKNIDELPEIKRAPISNTMKDKMKQEYLGLGGAENKAMGANYFLWIIVIISVLAVATKLSGAI